MASSLYNLALDFSKELNYTKAIMARQGDKGITVTVKPFLNGLQMDTSGGIFTLKGTTPSNRYVDSVATSVTSEEVTFSLDGTFMSETGYYKHCYVEYRKDNQILTTQDIIFFSLGVSDISQGQADEYVSQLEELIQKYNETFDAFMAEIKGRVDSLNQQITDLTGQAKTLQEKLDALKEEISKLGNLQTMYSNSIDFGDYDYSGNPNLMIPLKASNFYTQSGVTVEDAGNALKVTFTKTDGAAFLESIENVPALVPNTQYTLSAEVTVSEGYAGKLENLRIGYRKGPTGTIILPLTCKEAIVGQKTRISITANSSALTDPSKFDRMYFTINTTSTDPFVGTVLIENIKLEAGSTATPYQPNLLEAPYYLSKVALGENIANPTVKFPITLSNEALYAKNASEDFVLGETYTVTIKATKPVSQTIRVYLTQKQFGDFKPVEGLVDTWVATVSIKQLGENTKWVYLSQTPNTSLGPVKIDWLKIEKGDTRTPNIEQYKYRGIGMRDSNNPKDYVWELAPEYVEDNLATDAKISEITGKANNYTDSSIAAVNTNVVNIADDLARQINSNKTAARNYTDTKKIEAVNESKKYTDEVFRKEIVNLTVKNGNLGTARLYRQGNCVTIYFFDLNGRNSGGNDSVILTVPEGYRTPISFEQLVGSTDRSAFNNAQLGFGADGNIYWRRNTSYASSYTFAVTYII
ncbi:hypothetical protein [Enterococcus faecium]|uniref:hypothetical protein n=1 Tax=Enterococcus faecium TaxID=1352 RepID=UPI00115DC219|nr:hypothetical protein [Enterococcus faecium]